MAEFIRLRLIVGEDLNTLLQAMQTEMETISHEFIRDLDIASCNTEGDPSGNPSVKVALNRFRELVRLKLSLPLAQLDAAHEDMDRFLHHRLSQLDAQKELKSLLGSLAERLATHQCRIGEIIQGEALKNSEVSQRVMVRVRAEQPLESNFFPGILEGLLGSLGINATGEKNPPTSSKESVAYTRWRGEMSLLRRPLGRHRDCISIMKRISCSAGLPRFPESFRIPSSYPA